MKHRSALLGTSTGVWATKRAAGGLLGQLTAHAPDCAHLTAPAGVVAACTCKASGAARTRE